MPGEQRLTLWGRGSRGWLQAGKVSDQCSLGSRVLGSPGCLGSPPGDVVLGRIRGGIGHLQSKTRL